jgi:hypothetical protein
MSAYDNPTIIKNDAALIWGQAAGGFAESFTQSYAAAKKEREAREKEARLEAEKAVEKKKQQDIADQVFISESRYKEQERLSKIDAGLEKLNVSPSGVALFNEYYSSTGKVQADNDYEINATVIGKDKANLYADYAAKRSTGTANLERVTGALYSQADAIRTGKINDTNIKKFRYKGDNIIDQAINRTTTMALAFPDDEKTIKNLKYDAKGDPSKIRLEVSTNVGGWNDLVKNIRDANLSIDEKEVENQINEEIKKPNGRIKLDDKGNYTINYISEINDKEEGTLYVEIPELNYVESAVKAGVYSKATDDNISNIYLKPMQFIDLEGNANLSAEQGKVMYKRTPVDMKGIENNLKPQLLAQAEGLIGSYMQDPTTADGILVDLGFPNNYYSKNFAKLGTQAKATAIAEKLLEKEKQNIIIKSQLKEINGEYYKMDADDIRIFNEESKKGGGGKSKAAKPTFDEVSSRVYAIQPGGAPDDFTWGNKKVSFDGINFVINSAGPNKDMAFSTKEEVINYLKTGKIK